VTIGSTTKWLRRAATDEGDHSRQEQGKLLELAARVQFLPDFCRFPAKIAAYFRQSIEHDGFHSIQPTILVHTIVPSDSEVFQLTEAGDLRGLLQLFKDGKASVRDCDERGRSLLSVSAVFVNHIG
jgi:hypothetical protein